MDSIKIATTQNVDLEYEAAGVGYRILATILDVIFMIIYAVIIMVIFGVSVSNASTFYEENAYLMATIFIILGLPVLLYHFLSETFMNGQSFGKKIIGIKVVKLDGTQPGIGSYLLRSLLRIIDMQSMTGLVALISVAVSEKSQRLGDMAAGTTVIKLGYKVSLRDTILYKPINDYKIVFDQVALLTDKDVAIIKEILEHSIANKKPENITILAGKVKTKMGVVTSFNDEQFLKTVLLDYSHYQFER
jgi:uncharacterized RDD family membrane protein YckC